MATVTPSHLTISELTKRMDGAGALTDIVEQLRQTNAILDDMPFVEANNKTSHLTTRRTSLPEGAWRQYNQGVASKRSETRQVEEAIGMLEAYSEVDIDLAKRSGNPAQFRRDEDMAFVQGLGQEMAETLIYGNRGDNIAQFNGLATRYDDVSTMDNVWDVGGSSNTTSFWIVEWGPSSLHGVYPNGSQIGLQTRDLGEETKQESDGTMWQVYRTHFKWDIGLAVRDTRAVQRLASIDINFSSVPGFDDYLIRALRELPGMGTAPGTVIYVNRDGMSMIDVKAKDKTNVNWSADEVFGRRVPTFQGVPIRLVDQILSTETAL